VFGTAKVALVSAVGPGMGRGIALPLIRPLGLVRPAPAQIVRG
jgi:hypothetical protein